MRIERVEKIGTFLLVHIDHVFEDLSTEIKCLSTGLGMGADNRMLVAGQTIALCVAETEGLVAVIVDMHPLAAVELLFHFIRQCLVGGGHIAEQGITAPVRRNFFCVEKRP